MSLPLHGAGVGLRTPHIEAFLTPHQNVDWLELLVDNWLAEGGLNRKLLLAISERYPVVLHGVGLSLGASEPLDRDYLHRIRSLKQETGAIWYSEHCSFSQHGQHYMPDLLPLPYTVEAVQHISKRIRRVQEFMGEQMLLENVSTYIQPVDNPLSEGEFMRAVAEESDCLLLLDLNNCFVNEYNNAAPAQAFLDEIPLERVRQIHLAGFEDKGHFLLDAHNNPVADPVWTLFTEFIKQHGAVPAMIEWDNDIPSLETLLAEQQKISAILQQTETGETRQCA